VSNSCSNCFWIFTSSKGQLNVAIKLPLAEPASVDIAATDIKDSPLKIADRSLRKVLLLSYTEKETDLMMLTEIKGGMIPAEKDRERKGNERGWERKKNES
jgi:hypothetical protein